MNTKCSLVLFLSLLASLGTIGDGFQPIPRQPTRIHRKLTIPNHKLRYFQKKKEAAIYNSNASRGNKGDPPSPKLRKKSSNRRRKNVKRKTRQQQRQKWGKNDDASLQTWRVFGVEVHPDRLEHVGRKEENRLRREKKKIPAEKRFLQPAVLEALFSRLKIRDDPDMKENEMAEPSTSLSSSPLAWPNDIADIRVVRRSLDGRQKRRNDGSTGPRFVYVIDVDIPGNSLHAAKWRHQPGRMERYSVPSSSAAAVAPTKTKHRGEERDRFEDDDDDSSEESLKVSSSSVPSKKRVIIVGAGPAGLFCALQLVKSGDITPIVLERGQSVESRGKDIGALIHRRSLDSESNFAFGEGGAGTWSDGKLTTRIGRNSESVRMVLETLVKYGAPENILVDGAPHLGTDNLQRLLRSMRLDLRRLGGIICFGTKVTRLLTDNGVTKGVKYTTQSSMERNIGEQHVPLYADDVDPETDAGIMQADAVVLATGHSARDMYEMLYESGVKLEAKGFAVGFRVEHPQKIINKIQYGTEWGPSVITGTSRTDKVNMNYFASIDAERRDVVSSDALVPHHDGTLPVPSYRLATDQASDGKNLRGVYSFCMCPGGQIVPASTEPEEVCVNGMSFSRRDSVWANSALVVTVSPDDEVLDPYREDYGVLAGVAFQREMERRASIMGGGNLTVPVQRLTDFLKGKPSTTAPPSSYRLGVKPAACHEIYPSALIASMRHALTENFEKKMPGFVCEEGLLHAVETRTSSPVRVSRNEHSMQADGTGLLFPAGEGAGFAGGIVSAAVDGLVVADAVIDALLEGRGQTDRKKVVKMLDTFY